MNSRHQNIKFTLTFLDISITRVGNKLQTSLFLKKIFSGIYSKFNGHLESEYKKSFLHTLVYRAYKVCSNYTNLHQKIVYLKSAWQKNSLPLFFIGKCVHKFLNSLFLKRHHLKLSSEKKEVITSLQFLGNCPYKLKNN